MVENMVDKKNILLPEGDLLLLFDLSLSLEDDGDRSLSHLDLPYLPKLPLGELARLKI